MSSHYHAVVWIDHRQARISSFDRDEVDRAVLHPHHPTRHIHHKANCIGSGHTPEDQDFLHGVAADLADAGAILITGPANAKTELVKHIRSHDPQLLERISGVETVDHPSDAALVAHSRRYFRAADRMRP